MRKSKSILISKINWQESYPSLILGAIIVVIFGLLIANYFSRKNMQQIDLGTQTQQAREEAMAPQEGSEYTIRASDSLSKISEQVYGSQEFWPILAIVNNIQNPDRILVDSKITVPPKADVEQMQTNMTATVYQVQAGETLFVIAEKVYGDGANWGVLDRANGSRRLPNGNPLVLAGSTIVIPR